MSSQVLFNYPPSTYPDCMSSYEMNDVYTPDDNAPYAYNNEINDGSFMLKQEEKFINYSNTNNQFRECKVIVKNEFSHVIDDDSNNMMDDPYALNSLYSYVTKNHHPTIDTKFLGETYNDFNGYFVSTDCNDSIDLNNLHNSLTSTDSDSDEMCTINDFMKSSSPLSLIPVTPTTKKKTRQYKKKQLGEAPVRIPVVSAIPFHCDPQNIVYKTLQFTEYIIRIAIVHNNVSREKVLGKFVHAADLGCIFERKSNISRLVGHYDSPSEKVLLYFPKISSTATTLTSLNSTTQHVSKKFQHVGQSSNALTEQGVIKLMEKIKQKKLHPLKNWITSTLLPELCNYSN